MIRRGAREGCRQQHPTRTELLGDLGRQRAALSRWPDTGPIPGSPSVPTGTFSACAMGTNAVAISELLIGLSIAATYSGLTKRTRMPVLPVDAESRRVAGRLGSRSECHRSPFALGRPTPRKGRDWHAGPRFGVRCRYRAPRAPSVIDIQVTCTVGLYRFGR